MSRSAWAAICLVVFLGALHGCQNTPERGGVDRFQFHLEAASTTPADRRVEATLPYSGSVVAVDQLPVFDAGDVRAVDLAEVALGPCLRFVLQPSAARSLYRISVEHRAQRLVFFVNGQPLGARVLDEVPADGVLFTFVEVPDADLPELVSRLRSAL